jgi:small-conductance mechanosensitive channel
MIGSEGSLVVDLAWVGFWGTVLAVAYLAVFRTVDLLPIGDDRRAAITRLRPLLGLLGALVFSLFSAQALFSRYQTVLPLALLLVLIGFFLGSRALLADVFSGIALRAERSIETGDHVRIGETEGRVTALGPRAVALQTPEGDSALIPYSRATGLPIIRTRGFERGASSSFTVSRGDLSLARLSGIVERSALLQHWGSVTRPPEITVRSTDTIEITVFSLSEDHTLDVQAAVTAALSKASAP